MITARDFVKMLNYAGDKILMKSVVNCHALHVSSIVLKSRNECLTRMFLAWPGHELYKNGWNSAKLLVGIHNHRYDLTLTPFTGAVENRIYEISNPSAGRLFDEYAFVSGVDSGAFQATKIGTEFLRHQRSEMLTKPVTMQSDEFHTVAAWGASAWLVEEGPAKTDTTRLFTNSTVKNDWRMYMGFRSPEDVREHCDNFLHVAKLK